MTHSAIFTRTLIHDGNVHSFHVHPMSAGGWIACERVNHCVVSRQEYNDWHRVERKVSRFMGDVAELRNAGWHDVHAVRY